MTLWIILAVSEALIICFAYYIGEQRGYAKAEKIHKEIEEAWNKYKTGIDNDLMATTDDELAGMLGENIAIRNVSTTTD